MLRLSVRPLYTLRKFLRPPLMTRTSWEGHTSPDDDPYGTYPGFSPSRNAQALYRLPPPSPSQTHMHPHVGWPDAPKRWEGRGRGEKWFLWSLWYRKHSGLRLDQSNGGSTLTLGDSKCLYKQKPCKKVFILEPLYSYGDRKSVV